MHIFVNQPVATPTTVSPAPAAAPHTYAAAVSQPRARISRTQVVNPYLRPLRLNPARHVTARYELRINVPPSTNPEEELRRALANLMTKIQEVDASLVVHPWAELDNRDRPNGVRVLRAISSPAGIPADIGVLKKYFPRVVPKAAGGFIYPSVWFGHTKPFSELMAGLSSWFQAERHGLWTRQLQCETTSIVGWALYSTQTMHVPTLRMHLSAELGYEVGIRWRTISTGQSEAIPKEQLAKALHFEVDRQHKSDAKRRLATIYDRSATEFPLGIKLRIVWPLHDLMNINTRNKVAALRLRQLQFCQSMINMRTWELHDLDVVDDTSGLLLRDRLMEIKSQSGYRLFHSVDPSHLEGATQFCFHPDREDEARTMILALVPYLRWKVATAEPDLEDRDREILLSRVVYRHFNQEALERAVGATWNPTTLTVDSPADSYSLWVHDTSDAELDCSKAGAVSSATIQLVAPQSLVRPHDAAADHDSISTLPQGTSIASTVSGGSAPSQSSSRASSHVGRLLPIWPPPLSPIPPPP